MKSLPTTHVPAHPLWQQMRALVQTLCVAFVVILCAAANTAKAQSECDMISFSWNGYAGVITDFDETFGEVYVMVPYGTLPSSVNPTIGVSPNATVSPASGESVTLTLVAEPLVAGYVMYTVTAQDGVTSKEYDVYFYEADPESKMLSMSFGGTPATIGPVVNGVSFVTITVPSGTNLTALAPTYTLSTDATCELASGSTQDFTNAVEYTVYDAFGYTSTTYVVMVTVNEPIFVNAGGSGILRFTKNPSASSWATLSVTGAAGNITTESAMDTAMNAIAAGSISDGLSNYSGVASSTAYWQLDRLTLGTQPTGNNMTLLKSTLKNTSGSTLGGLAVSYELGATNTPAEQINGYRVYWSLTGAAGSWTPAGTHLQTSSGVSTINFNIEFTSGWANNGDLYVVWADDNGTGTQGEFTLDRVSFTPIAPAANFLSFGLPGNPGNFVNNDITLFVPFGTDVSALSPTYTLSYGATCNKASGEPPQDFTTPVQYTVTSSAPAVSRTYTVSVVVATSYWAHGPWTNDADSGIDSNYPYTVAVNFGGAAVTVNGVPFQASATSGTNFSLGGNFTTYNNDSNTVTGNSSLLAKDFFYNGTPRTVTLSNLTPGATYETSFFSVGWENSGRVQDFASGTDVYRVDQDFYGNNNGIRIYHYFVATSPTRSFTITPYNSGNTLHFYAMANRMVNNPNALVTTTQLVSSPNPSSAGNEVTFTATLKNGGITATDAIGSYTFRRNGTLLSVVSLSTLSNGVATYTTNTLTPGSQTISASYSGGPIYRSSEASIIQIDNTPLTLTVNDGAGGGTYQYGTNVTITANSPNVGFVFSGWIVNSGNPVIANANAMSTTLTMGTSHANITASYRSELPGGVAPLAWYDAANIGSIAHVSNVVSQWSDVSGNGNHATQTTPAQRPTRETGGIRFGVNDVHLDLPRMASDAYTIMMVAQNNTAFTNLTAAPQMPLSLITWSNGPAFGSSTSTLKDEVLSMLEANAANNFSCRQAASKATLPSISANPHVYSFILDNNKTNWHIGVDGSASLKDLSAGTRHPYYLSQYASAIGANVRNNPTVEHEWNGLISEVIFVSNEITEAQRQKIEGYLAWKWDDINNNNLLVSALPGGHPFKNSRPVTNTTPVAIAQNVAVTYATAKSITLNGSDADTNLLTYAIVTQPSHGTLTGTAPGITYTPALGYNGSDSFTFKVNDGIVDSPPATVSITVADGDRYAEWNTRNGYNLTGGMTGDDDGDGVRNFDEFAFGLNPKSGASANPIIAPLSKVTHAFTYTRYAYSKLAYSVWTSTDLVNWGQNPAPVTEVVSEPNANGVVTVQATLNSPPLDPRKFFLRVKAE